MRIDYFKLCLNVGIHTVNNLGNVTKGNRKEAKMTKPVKKNFMLIFFLYWFSQSWSHFYINKSRHLSLTNLFFEFERILFQLLISTTSWSKLLRGKNVATFFCNEELNWSLLLLIDSVFKMKIKLTWIWSEKMSCILTKTWLILICIKFVFIQTFKKNQFLQLCTPCYKCTSAVNHK